MERAYSPPTSHSPAARKTPSCECVGWGQRAASTRRGGGERVTKQLGSSARRCIRNISAGGEGGVGAARAEVSSVVSLSMVRIQHKVYTGVIRGHSWQNVKS